MYKNMETGPDFGWESSSEQRTATAKETAARLKKYGGILGTIGNLAEKNLDRNEKINAFARVAEKAYSEGNSKFVDNMYVKGTQLQKMGALKATVERVSGLDDVTLKGIVQDKSCGRLERCCAKNILENRVQERLEAAIENTKRGDHVDLDRCSDYPDTIKESNAGYEREYYRQNPEELLAATRTPENLDSSSMSLDEKKELYQLCQEIQDNLSKDDETVSGNGELLPEYSELLENGGYMDVEEMCNGEGVNISDVYDNESKRYSDEFKRGFIDFIRDGSPNPWDTDVEEMCNDAYFSGLEMADRLVDLLNS